MHALRTPLTALALSLAMAGMAHAQAPDKVKIGFITDMSSNYADVDGKNGAVAIQMAIDDFGGKVLGKPIELLTLDHQHKPDIAATKAREWIDTQDLSMLLGGTNSGVALALAKVAQEKKRVYINNGAGTSALTNEQCSPYTIHYAYDTVALAKGTGGAVVDNGGKEWFFLTADYAFGHSLENDTANVVKAKGGNVKGSVRHPLNASDFSSFLLQAQNSKAQILGLANAGGDTINTIKAAKEFGINKNMKLAGLLVFLTDVHSLGLRNTEGVFRSVYGVSGLGYDTPELLEGASDLGFMMLPNYRVWVVVASVVVCMATWYVIEKTRLGAYLRAGTENPRLVEAFGINVPLMVTLTYAFGVGLAAFAGVLAAPVYQVTPLMGQNLIIVVFAVVVIGGMGSIMGSILTGLGLGVVEGLTKVFYPEASSTVVFVIMVIVLLIRPAGLFGKEK